MAFRGTIERFAAAIVLAAVAGFAGASLIGAALIGEIDSPLTRGRQAVSLAEHPAAFWLSVAFWVVLAVSAGGAAFAFSRKSAER